MERSSNALFSDQELCILPFQELRTTLGQGPQLAHPYRTEAYRALDPKPQPRDGWVGAQIQGPSPWLKSDLEPAHGYDQAGDLSRADEPQAAQERP